MSDGHRRAPGRPRYLESIQQLRGVAASLVVVHHSAENYPDAPVVPLDWGLAGVAIFFCISGFIIWTSSRQESAPQFVGRRLARIVPLYWIALLAVVVLGVRSWGKPFMAPTSILASALFVPYYSGAPTGLPYPVLVPGWTLNFEMFFYAVFAVGIAVRRPLVVPVVVMTAFFVAGQVRTFDAAPLALYTRWLSILFVAGLLIGRAESGLRLPAGVWPLGAALVLAHALLPWPLATLGCGVALLVAGLTAREQRSGWPRIAPLKALGDASYAIYLFHMPAIFVLGFATHRLFHLSVPWPLFATACVLIAWAVGIAGHRWIEKPIARRLRRAIAKS